MTIYVSKDGSKFFNTTNSFVYKNIMYEELLNQGFNFITDFGDQVTGQKLIGVIDQLQLKQKLELTNLLLKQWHQEPISVQDSFDEYFSFHDGDEDYGQDDFLEELLYGNECILDGLQNIYSEISSYWDFKIVFSYLDEVLSNKNWQSWYLTGYSQGEFTFAWYFDSDNEINFDNYLHKDDGMNNYFGETIQEVLTNVIYDNYINIAECNDLGSEIDGLSRYVAGFFVPDVVRYINQSNQYLDDYMLKMYNAIPANAFVKYFVPEDVQVKSKNK